MSTLFHSSIYYLYFYRWHSIVLFQNMHNPPRYSPKTCQGGCICEKGFVLEPMTKECIKPAECPCHHGGRSYADQEEIKDDCNTWYDRHYLVLVYLFYSCPCLSSSNDREPTARKLILRACQWEEPLEISTYRRGTPEQ